MTPTDQKPRVLLLVPDGVGLRNFVLGRLPSLLSEDANVMLLHGLPEQAIAEGFDASALHSTVAMPKLPESVLARWLREAKSLGQIYWRYEEDAGDLQLTHRRARGSFKNRLFSIAVKALARVAGGPKRLDLLDRLHERATCTGRSFETAQAMLSDLAPDVVFCTHQRASTAVVWMAAARKLGIPTATFIFSWDNPPKGRMAVPSDHLMVWGEQMLKELHLYYPSWPREKLHVVGTPQFEPYWQKPKRTRQEFFEAHGLDGSRPVLCFSGDDFTSSPRDQDYLVDLAVAARSLPISRRPQILLRRSPVDRSGRHDRVAEAFPEIVSSPPLWSSGKDGDWQQVLPTPEDIELLSETVQFCDAVVNFGSTMALDFALVGKPSFYFAYEPTRSAAPYDSETKAPSYTDYWSAREAYRLPHFRLVHSLKPVSWVRNVEDLPSAIENLLRNPEDKAENRKNWIEALLAQPTEAASARIAKKLLSLAQCEKRT